MNSHIGSNHSLRPIDINFVSGREPRPEISQDASIQRPVYMVGKDDFSCHSISVAKEQLLSHSLNPIVGHTYVIIRKEYYFTFGLR
ncbi:MAG TPA: hypothetical protein PLX89_20905 [Verrucomicrobiota bacterium]|nr:hypothetical protein [Verrucomicrobiota bacterium]